MAIAAMENMPKIKLQRAANSFNVAKARAISGCGAGRTEKTAIKKAGQFLAPAF
ncbi:hypothetical protein [Izhakiella australiensis]|uniref:hypothetical protein n=1 Tax=Izhakiella australiensis TaxID=1926881 RepID=UPI00158FEE99|nr:hypothetical protein [Izhakiella australiensis]